jgi:hypothetical protein
MKNSNFRILDPNWIAIFPNIYQLFMFLLNKLRSTFCFASITFFRVENFLPIIEQISIFAYRIFA